MVARHHRVAENSCAAYSRILSSKNLHNQRNCMSTSLTKPGLAPRRRTCRQVRNRSGAEASRSRLQACCALASSTCRCATAYTIGGSAMQRAAAANPSTADWIRASSPVTDPLRSPGRRRAPFARGPNDGSNGSASRQYSPASVN